MERNKNNQDIKEEKGRPNVCLPKLICQSPNL